ncbi:hypothetical protein EYF80_001859 [Liparis tanakae]|uniref:Uncharacterized protein n=1 Tax=Liparis tanakae TaxID=230148 RepID=A0A4Z2JC52_9TELE|nr:hypothetical protein EYF80_001859 [Liparis tanakae]
MGGPLVFSAAAGTRGEGLWDQGTGSRGAEQDGLGKQQVSHIHTLGVETGHQRVLQVAWMSQELFGSGARRLVSLRQVLLQLCPVVLPALELCLNGIEGFLGAVGFPFRLTFPLDLLLQLSRADGEVVEPPPAVVQLAVELPQLLSHPSLPLHLGLKLLLPVLLVGQLGLVPPHLELQSVHLLLQVVMVMETVMARERKRGLAKGRGRLFALESPEQASETVWFWERWTARGSGSGSLGRGGGLGLSCFEMSPSLLLGPTLDQNITARLTWGNREKQGVRTETYTYKLEDNINNLAINSPTSNKRQAMTLFSFTVINAVNSIQFLRK